LINIPLLKSQKISKDTLRVQQNYPEGKIAPIVRMTQIKILLLSSLLNSSFSK